MRVKEGGTGDKVEGMEGWRKKIERRKESRRDSSESSHARGIPIGSCHRELIGNCLGPLWLR